MRVAVTSGKLLFVDIRARLKRATRDFGKAMVHIAPDAGSRGCCIVVGRAAAAACISNISTIS